MKKPIIRRSALAVVTCPKMDNHGIVSVSFRYRDDEPLVFTVSLRMSSDVNPAVTRVGAELDRAAVYGLLTDGIYGEVLVLGETSVKVRESARHQTCFKLPPREGDEGAQAMFIIATDFVKKFIEDTYRVVPRETEDAFISECVDKFLASIGDAK